MKKTISRNTKTETARRFWLAMDEFAKERSHVLSTERKDWKFERNGAHRDSKPRRATSGRSKH